MAHLRTVRARLVATLVVLLVGSRDGAAQITGSIAGTVRDTTGALLPGAALSLRGPALRGATLTTVTEPGGTYRFLLVPTGVYELTVELTGFRSQVREDIEVGINQLTTLDFTMSVAGVSESLTVSAEPPLVEVTRSDVASRVQGKTVDTLPLNGRNFVDLIGLVPGALPVPAGQPGANVSIFGERGVALSFLVDGAENNDPLNGGPFVRLTQDAVQEFEVVTSGYEAEFGRAQGGIVNLVTRSGTNSVDSRAFAFFRNDRFDSSNVVGQQPPTLHRAQGGGTVGGPIKRDRLFFFGSFEALHETRGLNIDRAKIPAFLTGGLATPAGKEDFGLAPETKNLTGLLKLDWTLNDRHRVSLSGGQSGEDRDGEVSSPIQGTIALPSAARTQKTDAFRIAGRGTTILRPSTFLESTAILLRGRNGSNLERPERPEPILVLLRSGFVQTGAPFGGKSDRTTTRVQVAQSLGHYRDGKTRAHQLKFGWDANHVAVRGFDTVTNDVEYSAAFLSPTAHAINAERFARLGFGQSAARFFSLPADPDGSMNVALADNGVAVFGQDAWQPYQAVTLDLGLRYDWSSLFGNDKNNVAPRIGVAWDLRERHRTVIKTNWGVFFDRNLLIAAATVPEKGGIFTRSAFDVTLPRLGFDYTDSLIDLVITSGFPDESGGRGPAENATYTPLANALRANPYALYDLLGIAVADRERPPLVTADNVRQLSGKSPAEAVALLERTFPGTDFEFFDVPGGSFVGNRVLSFFPRGPLRLSRDVSRYAQDRTPWTHAFSVGLDQQLPGDIAASLVYVSRRTRDLLTRRIVNLFDVPPGDPAFGRTRDGGPRISQVTYEGWIDYDGVILAARRRFGHNYQFAVSYTGARARDNLLTGGVGSTFSNNNHPELERGPSNQSAPHIFVANGLVALPWDLTVSGIVYWRSGAAFNPRGIRDLDGDGLVDQRDTSKPRNGFRTKAYGDVDLRVEKIVRAPHQHALSVLIEAFNLTNRANVRNVNSVSGPEFGTPNTFFAGREVQLGVRYVFRSR